MSNNTIESPPLISTNGKQFLSFTNEVKLFTYAPTTTLWPTWRLPTTTIPSFISSQSPPLYSSELPSSNPSRIILAPPTHQTENLSNNFVLRASAAPTTYLSSHPNNYESSVKPSNSSVNSNGPTLRVSSSSPSSFPSYLNQIPSRTNSYFPSTAVSFSPTKLTSLLASSSPSDQTFSSFTPTISSGSFRLKPKNEPNLLRAPIYLPSEKKSRVSETPSSLRGTFVPTTQPTLITTAPTISTTYLLHPSEPSLPSSVTVFPIGFSTSSLPTNLQLKDTVLPTINTKFSYNPSSYPSKATNSPSVKESLGSSLLRRVEPSSFESSQNQLILPTQNIPVDETSPPSVKLTPGARKSSSKPTSLDPLKRKHSSTIIPTEQPTQRTLQPKAQPTSEPSNSRISTLHPSPWKPIITVQEPFFPTSQPFLNQFSEMPSHSPTKYPFILKTVEPTSRPTTRKLTLVPTITTQLSAKDSVVKIVLGPKEEQRPSSILRAPMKKPDNNDPAISATINLKFPQVSSAKEMNKLGTKKEYEKEEFTLNSRDRKLQNSSISYYSTFFNASAYSNDVSTAQNDETDIIRPNPLITKIRKKKDRNKQILKAKENDYRITELPKKARYSPFPTFSPSTLAPSKSKVLFYDDDNLVSSDRPPNEPEKSEDVYIIFFPDENENNSTISPTITQTNSNNEMISIASSTNFNYFRDCDLSSQADSNINNNTTENTIQLQGVSIEPLTLTDVPIAYTYKLEISFNKKQYMTDLSPFINSVQNEILDQVSRNVLYCKNNVDYKVFSVYYDLKNELPLWNTSPCTSSNDNPLEEHDCIIINSIIHLSLMNLPLKEEMKKDVLELIHSTMDSKDEFSYLLNTKKSKIYLHNIEYLSPNPKISSIGSGRGRDNGGRGGSYANNSDKDDTPSTLSIMFLILTIIVLTFSIILFVKSYAIYRKKGRRSSA